MFGKLKGFKTVGLNVLSVAAAVASSYGVLPAVDPGFLAGVIAVGNLVLRFATNTPVFTRN